MVAKLTRLTHKIATKLHPVAESCIIAVRAPGGQSRNFWLHPRIFIINVLFCFWKCPVTFWLTLVDMRLWIPCYDLSAVLMSWENAVRSMTFNCYAAYIISLDSPYL